MKIISIGTLKGGVGKSMTVFNIAGILAEMGKRVLVIDVDPQGNCTNNFGVDRTTEGFKSVKDIMEKRESFEKIVIKSPIKELPSLDLLPSSIFLTGTELLLVSSAGRENRLKNYIEDNRTVFEEYEYIIIDTNPSMGIINQNAFVIADSIVLVSDFSMNSIEGAQLFIALWNDIRKNLRIKNNIKGFVINMHDKRIKISQDFIEFCKKDEEISRIIFDTIIPSNVKLKESELEAKPINMYDKTSKGYEGYNNLVKEMLEKGVL